MGNEHVIPEFINRFKKLGNKKNFLIYGTGQEIRSFIHIDDFVSAFYKVFKKGKNREIYNIGTNEKIRISKLAKLIAKILGKSIKFKKAIRLKDGIKKILN